VLSEYPHLFSQPLSLSASADSFEQAQSGVLARFLASYRPLAIEHIVNALLRSRNNTARSVAVGYLLESDLVPLTTANMLISMTKAVQSTDALYHIVMRSLERQSDTELAVSCMTLLVKHRPGLAFAVPDNIYSTCLFLVRLLGSVSAHPSSLLAHDYARLLEEIVTTAFKRSRKHNLSKPAVSDLLAVLVCHHARHTALSPSSPSTAGILDGCMRRLARLLDPSMVLKVCPATKRFFTH
jgi:hypothetical protein